MGDEMQDKIEAMKNRAGGIRNNTGVNKSLVDEFMASFREGYNSSVNPRDFSAGKVDPNDIWRNFKS